MDITALAKDTVTYLAPALPFLLAAGKTLGEKALEKVGESLGEEGWSLGKSLWAKLSPQVAANQFALKAAEDLAQDPQDEDNQAAFRKELKQILANDDALAAAIEAALAEAKAIGVTVVQTGDRNIFSQGNYNINVTGDNAKLSKD